ncbi:MAG TPA: histidine--tRNA ligase [Candidatus Limnocylindrales bacterium]|nr:histidine--tRNA ligase [Candidatus Limnocylindrales bacterium]
MRVAQRPRGTQDILPAEQPYWLDMTRTAEALAAAGGYQRIDTPIFEATELFVRTAGDTSDLVTKEMYTFVDRGGRSMTLRPEGTAPVVRAYFDAGFHRERQPVRLYYVGPFFRYDRPQAGRFRQFHQFGVEVIGDPSPDLDVEVIALGWDWYAQLGIRGVSLQLNSIGDAECRPRYRDALRQYYQPYLQTLAAEDRARFERNPLRLLDSKDPDSAALHAGSPQTLDFLCPACREAFERVQAGLRGQGIPFTINPRLVRGLDYYTRTAFEYWHESLSGAQNSLGGGGRYDGLAQDLGYPSTPGVGFALGLERTASILRAAGSVPGVYGIAVEAAARPALRALTRELRERGVAVVTDLTDARLDAKLKRAVRLRMALALLVGLQEDGADRVTVRDLRVKSQRSVPRTQLLDSVLQALRPRPVPA